ncbi:MAG: hypothetical protein F6K40_30530 [Okeania sp. SIO3I5]|uniref:hypothetical protein n=1 Tax=Okeania sp. SIO3I5 TaxID=2607805 RepID=UPI0013BAF227|nr:hypothetical protein [Okeania sp. SIO3I5]NEQ40336.1 hypothetical protein [Okeania sp. SIO3I5]
MVFGFAQERAPKIVQSDRSTYRNAISPGFKNSFIHKYVSGKSSGGYILSAIKLLITSAGLIVR